MENRLNLNKRIKYELPDEVVVEEYRRNVNQIPDFEPDIIINSWGKGRFCSIGLKYERAVQLWINTKNIELIDFIKQYDFNSKALTISSPRITVTQLKKIILEEFYGKQIEVK